MDAGVAQLAEQHIRNVQVSGSNPLTSFIGEVTERLKVHDWKSCFHFIVERGFESLPLRNCTYEMIYG